MAEVFIGNLRKPQRTHQALAAEHPPDLLRGGMVDLAEQRFLRIKLLAVIDQSPAHTLIIVIIETGASATFHEAPLIVLDQQSDAGKGQPHTFFTGDSFSLDADLYGMLLSCFGVARLAMYYLGSRRGDTIDGSRLSWAPMVS